ncbi:hypothetical protein FJY63_02700, partial [Candidatus Sumerlaeota bacterium]|nr:hypothetical protein [Candidatus Sumerlaeota bacterium]
MTTLDDLLDAIDPRNTLDKREADADEALNTFPRKLALIERWDGFRFYMARFYCHVVSTLHHLAQPIELSFDLHWSMCAGILTTLYGPGGFRVAFEIARTGKELGLYGIMKAVAKQIAKEQADKVIHSLVDAFLNHLNPEEQERISVEYVQKFGHLLPSELREGRAVRITRNLQKILQQHPAMVQKLRG